MKKAIIALAVVSLVILPLTIATACGPDSIEEPVVPGEELGDQIVSATASAIGAALDRVAMLPENRNPIRQGSRTFEVNGVLVRVAPDIAAAGIESVIRERGWTLAERGVDPRICDETMPNSWGWAHCVLTGNSRALYLDVRSATGVESGGYQVAIQAYRNTSVPYNRDLAKGVGFSNESEYDRLVTRLSNHPGVLNGEGMFGDPGMFHVTVSPTGSASHQYKGPSKHHGPFRYEPGELAWNEKYTACNELRESGDKDGYRQCMDEYWEMGDAMMEAMEARAQAAVIEARAAGVGK